MPLAMTWKDTTRFAEFRETKVGRKILARALSKTAVTGKAEGKRLILQVYTVKTGKVKLYTRNARPERLEAEVGASSTDQRGKKAIPLHEFKFTKNTPRKGQRFRKGTPPPILGEIVRGQPVRFKGGFSQIGANSGKVVTIARVGKDKYPTRTLTGPSAGAMLLNTRVADPLLKKLADRLPVVLDQEFNFAMNFEVDKGKEVSTDDVGD